jgi:NADPH:quinone reductase
MQRSGSGRPAGVDRVIEVSLSDNADLDVAVLKVGGVIAAYASRLDRPELPFWPLLFSTITLRLLGSDDFREAAKLRAVEDLTAAAREGALAISIA